MALEDFWRVVDSVANDAGADMESRCVALETHLRGRPSEEILEFIHLFDSVYARAYTWDLWGAQYLIRGGCSDDAFSDFRSALISHGQTAFEGVLKEPDTLAMFDKDFLATLDFEGYQYIAPKVICEKQGTEVARIGMHPKKPLGAPFEETRASLSARFPRLWEQFGWSEEQEARSLQRPELRKKSWWKFW